MKTTLELNIAEFLAEYFLDITGAEDEFSYGLFWDTAVADRYDGGKIDIFTGNKQKRDGSFYYEYGLLQAENEMEAGHLVTELKRNSFYVYKICYENPYEQPVSYYFYTKTRIAAFVQHDNEVMNLAAEMQGITQQKPILCLESHTRLFRSALDSILQAYSKGEYSNEDLRKEYCPDNSEVAIDWMRYKFGCSGKYEADYCAGCSALETNVGYAIDAAWTWFHTGFVNNFISKDPETNLLHLNW